MTNPTPPRPFDLTLGLEDTHVLITGGCGLIGGVVVEAFHAAGSLVSVLDLPSETVKSPLSTLANVRLYTADISSSWSLDDAFTAAEKVHGVVECCIALASIDLSSLTQTESLCDLDDDIWRLVMDVNVTGTFLTCKRWLRGIREASGKQTKPLQNVSCVLMGSESGKFGVRTMAAYAAGKAAVQYGLLQSLAKDAPRVYAKARVNAIAPGAVDTARFREECERYGEEWKYQECEATVGLRRAVPPEDVARTILVLASERFSGSTHGQVVHVDGGKVGSVVWGAGEM